MGRSIWDPGDDEWAEVDATKVTETFRASYKEPRQYTPQKLDSLSRFCNSVHNTFKSIRTLPTSKSYEDQQLGEEEQLRDKLEMLKNTYYCNPDGDLCDQVMQQVYLGGSRYFEMSVSARSMHVINLEAYFNHDDPLLQESKPRLCDAVATVLSHTSKECLEAYLNPAVEEFTYRRELDRNKAGLILVIRRAGNQVIVGSYRNFGFTLQWTLYVKTVFNSTGQWHDIYAALKPGHTKIINGCPDWDNFVPGDTTNQSSPSTLPFTADGCSHSFRKIELASPKKKAATENLSPEDPKYALYQSRLLAHYLLEDIWIRFDGLYECRAIWEADGQAQDVRLKRALVGFGDDDEGDQ
ncbi:hypothetical protein ACN47E_005297 [Coniothyrium glycines]